METGVHAQSPAALHPRPNATVRRDGDVATRRVDGSEHATYAALGTAERVIDVRDGAVAAMRPDEPLPVRRRSRWSGVARTPVVLLLADLAAWAVTVSVLPGTGLLDSLLLDAVLLLSALAVLGARRAYQARLTFSALDQIPTMSIAAGIGTLATIVVAAGSSAGVDEVALLGRGVVLLVALVAMRSAAVAVIRWVRRRGLVDHRTIVLGGGHVGRDLVARLLDHPELGLRPVGVLDPQPRFARDDLRVPWLGGVDRLADVVLARDVDVVVVAYSRLRESDLVEVLRTCDRLECEFFFVPRLFELANVGADMDEAWGVPLTRVRRAAFRTATWRVKRMVDLAAATLALVVAAPVLATVALAVRAEGGPGIVFRQERVGLDGRRFTMMKFRSMRPADSLESQTRWNVSTDDRVGPVGRLIRATSLDELPQLVNVLRGDMSIVGPRPERPHFVDEFAERIPRYTGRHRVPAGLTGLAAVYGLRGDTSIEERAKIDNYYIENWSLWLDVKVVLRTVVSVLRRTGS